MAVMVRKPEDDLRDKQEIQRRRERCGTLKGMTPCDGCIVRPLGNGNVNRLNLCNETARPEKGGESYLMCIGIKICPRGLD